MYMNRFFAMFFQIKLVYYLKINHYDYEKTVKDIYNELESYL